MADKFLTPETIKAATTSVSLFFYLKSQAGVPKTALVAAGVNASYCRQGDVRVAIVETDLAAVNSAWSSGGFKELDATNMPGWYRLDVPDAAFVAGADFVLVTILPIVTGTFETTGIRVALPTYADLRTTILSKIIEDQGSITAQQALSIMLAVLGGVTGTQGSVLKTPNGSATRVSATINASNERTAMTLTPSAGA